MFEEAKYQEIIKNAIKYRDTLAQKSLDMNESIERAQAVPGLPALPQQVSDYSTFLGKLVRDRKDLLDRIISEAERMLKMLKNASNSNWDLLQQDAKVNDAGDQFTKLTAKQDREFFSVFNIQQLLTSLQQWLAQTSGNSPFEAPNDVTAPVQQTEDGALGVRVMWDPNVKKTTIH